MLQDLHNPMGQEMVRLVMARLQLLVRRALCHAWGQAPRGLTGMPSHAAMPHSWPHLFWLHAVLQGWGLPGSQLSEYKRKLLAAGKLRLVRGDLALVALPDAAQLWQEVYKKRLRLPPYMYIKVRPPRLPAARWHHCIF